MYNFKIIELEKLKDISNFQPIEEGVYKDLKDKSGFPTHRIAMSLELEEGEDSQYPLEDILDNYLIHVDEFLDIKVERMCGYIFGGDLDNIRNFKSIIGKRAYNKEFVDRNGETKVKLIIE